ncbi:MAG: MBL fold metallo-hydrolase [Candidatus Thorarchaeota archaeon]
MRITLLGTGTSYPDPERVQSGLLVETGNDSLLVDIGSGVLHRLTQSGVDLGSIEDVFITHLHVDHCSDLFTLIQTLTMIGHKRTLNVTGPPALPGWGECLLREAYGYLGDRANVRFVAVSADSELRIGDLLVRTTSALHGTMYTLSLRLEHADGSVFISSDTAPCESVLRLARGADVMIHECNWLDGEHPPAVHTSPSELRGVVAECRPGEVVITHLGPDVVAHEEQVIETVRGDLEARVTMGRDLLSIGL